MNIFFVQAVLIFSNIVFERVFYVSKDFSKFRYQFIRYIWILSLFDLERLQFQNPISPQFLEERLWEKIYGKLAQTFDVLNICDLICDED